MKARKMVVLGMAFACGLAIAGEALAAGPVGKGQGGGDQLRLRDGSCLTTTTVVPQSAQLSTTSTTPIRQRLQDGSCQTTACDGTPDRLRDRIGSMNGNGYGVEDLVPDADSWY